jgi:N-acetylmuramoyl-L-alanine amidase
MGNSSATIGRDKIAAGHAPAGPTGRRFFVAAAASAVLMPRVAHGAVASAIRLHDHTTHTRFVVELSGNVEFKIRSLASPYRLAIDVPALSWSVPLLQAAPVGLISKVECAPQGAASTGIFLDLTGPARVLQSFVLPATATTPTRLVIDLEPTTAEAYLASASEVSRGGKKVAVEKSKPAEFKKRIIVLDPGHGGIDPGSIGQSGTYEKFITLAAARDLKMHLEATGRYKVMLTRDGDESLALRKRTEIAHGAEADIFISLHADSIADPSIRGLSVYTLSEKASDAEAEALAAHENQADIIIGMDLTNETAEVRNILVDLAQRESRNLATHLAGKLIGELQREVRLLPNTHRFAGFAVLKSPDIPSVLIEMGYMSNRADESDLKKDAYRGKLMAAILRGLDQYFSPTVVARQL